MIIEKLSIIVNLDKEVDAKVELKVLKQPQPL